MKNMNKKIVIIGLLFGMFGCDEYLDIVPDQTQQMAFCNNAEGNLHQC